LLHPDDKEWVLKEFNETLYDYTGQKTYDVEYRLLTKNRGYRWYRAVGKPTRRPDGSPVTYVGVFFDITEQKESAQNLSVARRMADTDPLTGVKNKNAYIQWEKKINAAIEKGEQEPFAVAVFDINDLKKVNDLHGHKEGDACIRAACKKICTIFDHSPVFRVGGDEFIAILSGEDYHVRKELMNQINAIPSDRSRIRLGETVSAGMAEYDREMHHSLLDVAEEADKAMYERKQYLKKTVLKQEEQPDSEESSDYIPVIHARKHILIVDDMELNREIMGDLLSEEYDISYASDGVEALQTLRSRKE
jgi:diguanylate cyclase (GGDEF)-like protein